MTETWIAFSFPMILNRPWSLQLRRRSKQFIQSDNRSFLLISGTRSSCTAYSNAGIDCRLHTPQATGSGGHENRFISWVCDIKRRGTMVTTEKCRKSRRSYYAGTAKGVQVTSHRVFKRGFAKFHNRSEALPLKILYPVSLWTTKIVCSDR